MPAVPVYADSSAVTPLQARRINGEGEERSTQTEAFQLNPHIFSGDDNKPRQLTGFALPLQKKENKTGLPDTLKERAENLSRFSMDDVQVHYNSVKPATLQAFAYAQGNDNHLGLLAHEPWHVVQQKQGRVNSVTQLKGVGLNNSPFLEAEADQMAKVLSDSPATPPRSSPLITHDTSINSIVQRMQPFDGLAKDEWDIKVDNIVQAISEEYEVEVEHEDVERYLESIAIENPRDVYFELDGQDELDAFLSEIAEVDFEDVYKYLYGGDSGESDEEIQGGDELNDEDIQEEESGSEAPALTEIAWMPELKGLLRFYNDEGWWVTYRGIQYRVLNDEGLQEKKHGASCDFSRPVNDIHKDLKDEIEKCGVKLTAIDSEPYNTALPADSEELILALQNDAYSLKNQPKESKLKRYKPQKLTLDYKVKWKQKATKFNSSNQAQEFRQSLDIQLGKDGPLVPGDAIHDQMFEQIAIRGNKVEVKFSIGYRIGKNELQLLTGASHSFNSGKNLEPKEKHANADRIASMLVDSGQLDSVEDYNDEKHSHSEQSMVVELSQTTDVFNGQMSEIIEKAGDDKLEICLLIIDMFSSPNTVCDLCYPSLVTLLTETDWKDLVTAELKQLLDSNMASYRVDHPQLILRVSSNTRYRGRAKWQVNKAPYIAKTNTGMHFIEKAPAENYY